MASTDYDAFANAPFLNPNEQNLLLNALKSNNGVDKTGSSAANALNPDLTTLGGDSALFDPALLENSLSNDFTWDLDESALDEMQGDNEHSSAHSADGDEASPDSQTDGKRKDHPDGDDEDSTSGKRRDSGGKVAKKPGRKPLMNEPTSKRKAQNRAAQRAFRERKEKHLRDLETKVDDLEKASEAANHENGILRAQVDRLNAQLSEYKKRLTSSSQPAGFSPSSGNKINWDLNQNFNFEFPRFGLDNDDSATTTKAKECANGFKALQELDNMERASAEQDFFRTGSGLELTESPSPFNATRSMSMSTSNAGSTYYASKQNVRSPTTSTDKSVSNTTSPASLGLGSSCVTTPEAAVDSPQTKITENNSFDIRASASPSQPKTPGQDLIPGLDWFANQNNGAFDPILFGDYREPQDNILSNAELGLGDFDSMFPWNMDSSTSAPWPTTNALEPALPPKKTLTEQVERAAQGKEYDDALNKPSEGAKQLTCSKLWDRVQRSEKVLSGEADMDDLCSQLKAKAKCGGPNKGAVVDERDVDAILGPDMAKANKTGMWNMFS